MIFASGCSSFKDPQPINIGLMDNYSSGDYTISHTANQFNYQPNGICNKNTEAVPCMWWGFEIGYDKQSDFITLECLSLKTNTPEPGNKHSLFTPSALQYRWQALLPPETNHQVIAMHISNESNQRGLTQIETTCKGNSIEPFAFMVYIDFDKKNKTKQD